MWERKKGESLDSLHSRSRCLWQQEETGTLLPRGHSPIGLPAHRFAFFARSCRQRDAHLVSNVLLDTLWSNSSLQSTVCTFEALAHCYLCCRSTHTSPDLQPSTLINSLVLTFESLAAPIISLALEHSVEISSPESP